MEFNATFLISAISFILFTITMNSIFYKPLTNIMEKRAEYIDDHYSEAESVNAKAKSMLDDKEQKLGEAKVDSRNTITKGVEQSEKNKSDMILEADSRVKEKLGNDRQSLANDENAASEVLKSQLSDISKGIAEKILKQDIQDVEYNSDLVNEAMKDV